jgi:hypothetical protein
MPKKSTGIIPPWINLKEAVEIISLIYDKGAGSLNEDDLATLLDTTIKSSSFRMRLVALRTFGLIRTESQKIQLTPLALAIVAPSSPDERQEALLKAFTSISLHESLFNRYKGGYLPEDSFLANTIQREYDVQQGHREEWVECFKQSGRGAGILRDEGGKIRVLQTPISSTLSMSTTSRVKDREDMAEGNISRVMQDTYPATQAHPKQAESSFPIVLDDKRSVIVPLDFDRDDLEYLQGILELYVKRRESKRQ